MQFTHNDTHKRKPKFIQRITATITALSIALTSMSLTALAQDVMFTNSAGGKTSAFYGDYDYGFAGVNNLGWKIDMYVSANPNGKVNPATDKIGSSSLPWVGAVLYEKFWDSGMCNALLVQTNETNETRTRSITTKSVVYNGPYPSGFYYRLPSYSPLASDKKKYRTMNARDVYHVYGNPIGLPMTSGFNYQTDVKPKLESAKGVTEVLNGINASLGGTEDNLKPLYSKILPLLGSTPKAKLVASKEATGKTDYDLLLPTNENCVVEWVAVATPMMGWTENRSSGENGKDKTFWESVTASHISIEGAGTNFTVFALDAYATAWFNETTKVMYKDSSFLNQISSVCDLYKAADGSITSKNGMIYSAKGKLVAELGSAVCDVAHAAYGLETINPYCGVPMAGSELAAFGNLVNKSSDFAKYGGISVYKSQLGSPGIPVFYYEYDPNTNQPTGNVFTETFQPNGDTTKKFQPSEAHGIPIAAESHKVNDKKRALMCEYPLVYFLARESTEPTAKKAAKVTILTHTMLAPHGVFAAYEINIPIMNVTTEITAEQIVTERKLLKIRIEHSAGNIIRLEISILPISRIPITIVTAVSKAIIIL